MRVPLAATLESRDGTVTKDAVVRNGIVETKGEASAIRKRPGLSDIGLMRAGVMQALTYWNGAVTGVVDDYLNVGVQGAYVNDTTWNSADKSSDCTLSNGDLTAAVNTVALSGGVRSVAGKATGKWYWEALIVDNSDVHVGFATSGHSLTVGAPSAGTGAITYHRGGSVYYNSVLQFSGATYANTDVIGILLDADARTVKFYKNNTLQGTVTSAGVPSGTLYAYFGSNAGNGTSSVTARFALASFGYTVPGVTLSSLTPTTADLQFSMQDNGANSPGGSLLMFKNSGQAWYVNTSGTVTQITDVDYPGTYAVSVEKLTRSSTTATAVTRTPTNFQVGSTVVIAGVNEAGWNGSYTITGVTAASDAEGTPIRGIITRSGTTATFTCTETPHGFANGASVTIIGASQSAYNGTKSITWTSATTFTFTVTVSGQEVVTPGTGTYYWSWKAPGGNQPTMTVASNVGTITFSQPHYLATGATIYVAASYSLYGTPQNFSGSVAVTVTSGTTLTVPTSGLSDNTTPVGVDVSSVVVAAASVTGDGALATINTSASHYLLTGATVIVYGGNESYYQTGPYGKSATYSSATAFKFAMTLDSSASPTTPDPGEPVAVGPSTPVGASFTFTVDGTETTPATGTITATSGRFTVPGIAFIDGYFAVMDIYGVIYTSEPNDPAAWEALHFITAQSDTGAGKYLGKTQSYVVAMKAFSTEFFYNAGNPTGSPLSPVANAFTQVGCAHGDSVAKVDGNIVWLSQTRESGRAVHIMNGMQQQKISTPDVDRILNADDLATVRGMGLKVDGHHLYVLTLVTSDITLVYDLTSQAWTQWSTLTIGSQVSVSSITRSGTTATVTTGAAHGFSDGAPVKISGATQSDYNGTFQIAYISTTSFSIEVANSPATPATGTILAYPYTETYFKFGHATSGDGVEYIAHESDGHIYEVDSTLYQDNAVPINLFVRTPRLDGAETRLKKMPRITLIGDKQSDTAMIRWSDDDSATFSAYRRVDLSDAEPMLRRCGSFRRRSIEVRHTGNTAQRFGSLELEVSQ